MSDLSIFLPSPGRQKRRSGDGVIRLSFLLSLNFRAFRFLIGKKMPCKSCNPPYVGFGYNPERNIVQIFNKGWDPTPYIDEIFTRQDIPYWVRCEMTNTAPLPTLNNDTDVSKFRFTSKDQT